MIGALLGIAGNIAGPWRLYAELAGAAALALALGAQTARLHSAEAGEATAKGATAAAKAVTAQVREQWAEQAAAGAAAGLKAAEANAAITAELQRTKEGADHALTTERAAAAAAAAGFAAERGRLRSNLAAYAAGPAGGGGAAGDSVAACHQRAAALGAGLAGTLRAEESLVSDLELCRADTRAVLDAWPRLSGPAP